MKEKTKGLLIDILVYLFAFGVAAVPFILIDEIFLSSALFTATATLVIFVFSTLLSDVSIYDPYWSVAPLVMILAIMVKYRIYTVNAFLLLALFALWSIRLTGNWYMTYRGLGHEDWRYAQYREKYRPFLFHFISFTGLHFIPTIVVYLGFVSAIFAMRVDAFQPLSLLGMCVMLASVGLEFFSDRAIHGFLKEHKGEHKTCDVSVWKYSRHPNYLGEMSFWFGAYLYFVGVCPGEWYKGLGFLSIIVLFLVVSIPMMEKHNAERREDYAAYRARTSMLLLLPNKKPKDRAEK